MAPIAATGQSQMEAAPNSNMRANSKFVKMPVVTEMTKENDTAGKFEKSFSVRRSSCL